MPSLIARSPDSEALTPGRVVRLPREEIRSKNTRNKLLPLALY
jgi:hypothetical protein